MFYKAEIERSGHYLSKIMAPKNMALSIDCSNMSLYQRKKHSI